MAPEAPGAAAPPVLPLGGAAPEFRDLRGADGRRYSRSSFDDYSVVVLVFVGNGCPSVQAYGPELRRLQQRYGPLGVQLVAVNANNASLSPPDTFARMVRSAGEWGWDFPYLKDEGGKLAKACGALTTPHAFVFDVDRRLRYRGRLADARDPSRAEVNYLEDALRALVAGQPVGVAETPPFGCSIVW